QNKLRVKDI
ncbi:hypothetical protein D039_4768B, partial [Vibrio parahaemolyticus EKP-028]